MISIILDLQSGGNKLYKNNILIEIHLKNSLKK